MEGDTHGSSRGGGPWFAHPSGGRPKPAGSTTSPESGPTRLPSAGVVRAASSGEVEALMQDAEGKEAQPTRSLGSARARETPYRRYQIPLDPRRRRQEGSVTEPHP